MNRILFEKSEIRESVAVFDDFRAEHVLNVLHGEPGQLLKTGEIDGPIGTSVITAIEGTRITCRCDHTLKSPGPWADIVLAPPRPRVLKRLLPQLATMGVGRIYLVGAKKVEKDFWGATLLKEENYRPLLVDGLMQGGTSVMPVIETRRNFRKFLREELDALFPSSTRIIAHPYADPRPLPPPEPGRRILLAIGPEGGWTDQEVEEFAALGFLRYSLGRRILRTDTASIALLARLSERYDAAI